VVELVGAEHGTARATPTTPRGVSLPVWVLDSLLPGIRTRTGDVVINDWGVGDGESASPTRVSPQDSRPEEAQRSPTDSPGNRLKPSVDPSSPAPLDLAKLVLSHNGANAFRCA
jgi:hypothetical protein